MIYPLFIIIVVIGVIGVMMVKIVPKLLEIFENKEALPASTKTLIAVSDFLASYWVILILFFVVLFIFVKIWKQTSG